MLSTLREDGKTDAFTYYLDGELWTATYGNPTPTRTVTYNIDQMGNRTSVVDTGVTTNYTQASGGLNQYAQVGTNTVGNGSEHEIASYQGTAYTYVNDERLSSITSGGNTYTLTYDALGRCVSRTLNLATTYFIYDGEKPIVEYSSAGGVVARNLYGKGIDEIIMRVDSTYGTYYFANDHEGNVTHLLGGTGTVLEGYRYDAFGAPTINGGALTSSAYGNRFMFTGREYYPEFGIYNYRARAYHPVLGRFTCEDPKGFDAGDYNLFRYVTNDPLGKTDPMGLDPGDPFHTSIAAGADATRSINVRSIHENREWGGLIYKQDGKYYATLPKHGTGMMFNPHDPQVLKLVPKNGQVTGDYHTHGAYSWQNNPPNGPITRTDDPRKDNLNSDHFSTGPGGDVDGIHADGAGKDEYWGVMEGPGGKVRYIDGTDPNSKERTLLDNQAREQSGSGPRFRAAQVAGIGLNGMQQAPIFSGGALGGGTSWGAQANGQFIDAPGSNVSLAGDIVGAQGGAIHPVPKWLY